MGHYPDVRDCISTAGLPDAVHRSRDDCLLALA
ncbi:hypothetical protein A2U01_0117765, partial [Trifolium medium]|nr:hypothetical protein [Trifolium medium]